MTTTALVVLECCSFRRVTGGDTVNADRDVGDDEFTPNIHSIGEVRHANAFGRKTFTSVPGMLCTGTLPATQMAREERFSWNNPFFLEDLYEHTNPYIALPNPWGGACIWPLLEYYGDGEMADKNREWCLKRGNGVARHMTDTDETTDRLPSDEILEDFDDWQSDNDEWFLYLHVQETHLKADYLDNPVEYADEVVRRVLEYDPDNIVVTADHSELYTNDVFMAADSADLWERRAESDHVTGIKSA